jgi:hypothetical protein
MQLAMMKCSLRVEAGQDKDQDLLSSSDQE